MSEAHAAQPRDVFHLAQVVPQIECLLWEQDRRSEPVM